MQPNMSEQYTKKGPDNDKLPPPTRGQRLAAFAFLGAFGLTILTVLLTGLSVGAPSARHLLQPAPPAADSAPAKDESRAGSESAKGASTAESGVAHSACSGRRRLEHERERFDRR